MADISDTPKGDREPVALPEGLIEDAYGHILFECRSCCAWTEWPAEIEDFELGNPSNVCGGSLRCVP